MTHFNDHGPWYQNQQISYQDIVKDMKTLFNIENDNTLEYLINQAFLEISDKSNVLLDITSSLYFHPPTTTKSSNKINTLTINTVGI